MKPFLFDELLDVIKKLLLEDHSKLENYRIKEINKLLLQENKVLKERNRQLTEGSEIFSDKHKIILLGVISHDLKGELMLISTLIKYLCEVGNSSKDVKEEYDMIERSLQHSQLLLRRLLNYLDIGKPKLETIDIIEVLKRTETFIRPRLPSHIDLKVDYNFRKAPTEIDAEQLMGVLIELIQNAIYALGQNGGHIEIHLKDKNGEIALSVKDNASGIPEELRNDLFKKEVKSKKGLGIGLFLCSKVINELGGKLLLEDTSEKGTTFTILLPKASDKKES